MTMLKIPGWLFAAALLAASPLTASAADTCAGVTLPAKAEAFGAALVRNGMGIREATFLNIDVYVAGLYTPKKTSSVAEIMKQQTPKSIVLRFVRDVSRDDMVNNLTEALRNNLGNDFGAAHEHFKRFTAKLPELRKGTELSLTYRPGNGLELKVNGKTLGTEKDDRIGNMVFRAWLGPKPPNAGLKAGLLGGPCE